MNDDGVRPQTVRGEALATLREVAAFLKVPQKTLYRWRYTGIGPPGYRVGKHLRFRWPDVEEWLSERGDSATQSGEKASKTCHKVGVGSRTQQPSDQRDGGG